MNKILPSLVWGAMGIAATAAQAAYVSTDIYTPGGGTLLGDNVYTIDYNPSGAAVASGAGPFGSAVAVGDQFDLRVMTTVTAFTDINNQSAATFAGLTNLFVAGAPFEITAVASLREVVIATSPNSATFAILPIGTVSLYYGVRDSDFATGAGFDNGTLIYRADVQSGSSSFTQSSATEGTGSINILGLATLIDGTVFTDLSPFLNISFVNPEGQTGYPQPTVFPTEFFAGGSAFYPTYVVDFANDLPLRFDGSSRFFQQTVPEPGTLALVGFSLAGLGLARRRKSA